MGLFSFVRRLFGGTGTESATTVAPEPPSSVGIPDPVPPVSAPPVPAEQEPKEPPSESRSARARRITSPAAPQTAVVLKPLAYQSSLIRTPQSREIVDSKPYLFAFPVARAGQFLDLSNDGDQRWLDYFGLPVLKTPEDLAAWLNLPIGQLAWLTHRTLPKHRPATPGQSHYVVRLIPKRSGGQRLLEAPKPLLKQVQKQILRDILDKVPAHGSAHGFVRGRSILTNARPHVGQRFLLKLDLTDFYTTVRYGRIVAIFRSLGYSREASIWLARLTTTSTILPPQTESDFRRFAAPHLPQGACTSPALANLSAFSLDVRLFGLAEAYGLHYTRYADDLTFSGPGLTIPALREVIPLVRKIVVSEKFVINHRKMRLLRNSGRQQVTGVMVNQKPNIPREEYDLLKAILHNCLRHGPSSQNRDNHSDFAAHLRGRIAFLLQLNPARGAKLLKLYEQINWGK